MLCDYAQLASSIATVAPYVFRLLFRTLAFYASENKTIPSYYVKPRVRARWTEDEILAQHFY